ncbi:MAG: ATP-binding protein [Defluviitaleaceae bacterium]|nr:ATP-binding protein [Defluviitaleaceae bacterium]
MAEEKKGFPIGVENFYDMVTRNSYYVDKTLLIKDVIDSQSTVTLCTRPRRFGKSLAISMLQYYFENLKKEDASIFDGLKIANTGEKYLAEQNKYPVIKLTMKSVEGRTFESAFDGVKFLMYREYRRHDYLLDADALSNDEKETFRRLRGEKATRKEYEKSLQFLSECLHKHWHEKVVILIDEYDVPLEKAYFKGYYDEMINFIRLFYGNALKTNDSLHKAILTGCLRVSKESIFTGLNNLDIVSIVSKDYAEYFGFTQSEVEEALNYYGKLHKLEEAQNWYNGYLFGETIVYNPWSMIKYLRDINSSDNHSPESYWGNTSSNEIIKELIYEADDVTKKEIESLMRNETLTKPIYQDIVYAEIKQNMNHLWSFLYFTGYLKKVSEKTIKRKLHFELKIPNDEIGYIYDRFISAWIHDHVQQLNYSKLYEAITKEDAETVEEEISNALFKTISYMDHAEHFYHGIMIGILGPIPGYYLKSNREAGHGRLDLMLTPMRSRDPGIVIEMKVAKALKEVEEKKKEALEQIEEEGYAKAFEEEGYRVIKYGIVFLGKECFVVQG